MICDIPKCLEPATDFVLVKHPSGPCVRFYCRRCRITREFFENEPFPMFATLEEAQLYAAKLSI